jgi:hypothetical protein
VIAIAAPSRRQRALVTTESTRPKLRLLATTARDALASLRKVQVVRDA